MVKTKGSRDRVRFRKKRSDIGKKREKYAGKPTKPRRKINGVYKPYVSTRKREDPISVGLYERKPMSHEGLINWSPKSRRKVHKYVYGTRLHYTVKPEEINNKEKIADMFCSDLDVGTWEFRLPSNKKNKGHVSYCCFAILKIKDSPEGMKCKVTPHFKRRSLRRLWWWQGE